MSPVFVALTAEGLRTAARARAALGGEVHAAAPATRPPFSHGEKGAAQQPDEGIPSRDSPHDIGGPIPSPVAFGDTLSPRERVGSAPDLVFTDFAAHVRDLFAAGRPIVGICAAGILIRVLAPLLADKRDEPPVLALSEDGAEVVPLLGGHRGANDLARDLAAALGGHAAVTTAGDRRFGVALDAPPPGWTLKNPEDAKPAMAALLAGAAARLEGHAPWLSASTIPFADDGNVRLVATTRVAARPVPPPSQMGEGDHAQHGGGGDQAARSLPPPPPASPVPLPRDAGEEQTADTPQPPTSPSRGGRNPQAEGAADFGRGAGPLDSARPYRNARASLLREDASRFDLPSRGRLEAVLDDSSHSDDPLALVYHPRRLALGLGCERGADPAEAIALVDETLVEAGLAPQSVALVASLDLKADEPAVHAVAAHLGVSARFFTAAALEAEAPRLKNPSETVFKEVGCHGVAEGAALAAAGAEASLAAPKRKSARVTCAVAEAPEVIEPATAGRARGRLAIVGIGPGAPGWLTPEARCLLQESDALVGYSLYLDLIATIAPKAERHDSALGSEEARVRHALALAAEGRSVALVCSGDAGIYAMATLAFECLDSGAAVKHPDPISPSDLPLRGMPNADGSPHPEVRAERASKDEGGGTAQSANWSGTGRAPSPVVRGFAPSALAPHHEGVGSAGCDDLPLQHEAGSRTASATKSPSPQGSVLPNAARRIEIVVSPGISAMQAAAARAGAPLGHDFCAISLSDLLTPWEAIEARIRAAAAADFVVAFYNPVSLRRRTQLAAAKAILLAHRPPGTPVVLARNLGRDGESVTTVTLAALTVDMVDMLTLVIVGASSTRQVDAAGRTWTYTPRGYDKKRVSDAAE